MVSPERIAHLLGPGFQLHPEEFAWLLTAINVEVSLRPRRITRDDVTALLEKGVASRTDSRAAKKLRDKGLPIMGEALSQEHFKKEPLKRPVTRKAS